MNTSIKTIRTTPTLTINNALSQSLSASDSKSEWSNLSSLDVRTIQEMVETDASGSTQVYTLSFAPIITRICMVFINGLLQRKFVDYIIINKQLIFISHVHNHANIIASYSYFNTATCSGITL